MPPRGRVSAGDVEVPVDPVLVAPPGVVVRVTVAPGVLVGDVLAPGARVPCALVVVAGAIAAGVVTVVVLAGAVELESPASLTIAAASTPSDSAITVASVAIRPFQLGDAARRVRAAPPQRRHHSCSGCSGAPHSGQASPTAAGGTGAGVGTPTPAGDGVATLTSRTPGA